MRKLLIKNGTVADSEKIFKADILISGEKIEKIAPQISADSDVQVVDVSGNIVMPGLIDAHTHYHLVSRGTVTADSFLQGSKLAIFGGVTTVVDFADHNKNQNLVESADYRLSEMRDEMAIDYTLHQGVYGHGYNSEIPAQLELLKAKGIKTLKIFTTYRETGYLIEEREKLSELFKCAAKSGLLVTAHCEYNPMIEAISNSWKGSFLPKDHADLRPSEAEGKAIEFYGTAAMEAGCPLYIVHVSSEAGINAIRALRAKGAVIYAETTPTYLFLDRSYLEGKDGSLYVMTPPLRTKRDNEVLLEALCNGEIQVVATDHCSFTREQKLSSSDVRTIYPGIPGTEEMFHLLYTYMSLHNKKLDVNKLVNLMSTEPAKLFGLYPQKGSLAEGTDADLCVYNPNERWILRDDNVHSASHYTPYRNFEIVGKMRMTVLRGKIVMKDGEYFGESRSGEFVAQS